VLQAPGGKLTQKQELLLGALLTSPGIEAAAEQCGLSYTTAYRWMRLPAFEALYREARRAVVDHAIASLQRVASKAVTTLETIMDDAEAPCSSRVAAARTTLELSLRGVELSDVLQRLDHLEHVVRAPHVA
jgi:hypothetical protein